MVNMVASKINPANPKPEVFTKSPRLTAKQFETMMASHRSFSAELQKNIESAEQRDGELNEFHDKIIQSLSWLFPEEKQKADPLTLDIKAEEVLPEAEFLALAPALSTPADQSPVIENTSKNGLKEKAASAWAFLQRPISSFKEPVSQALKSSWQFLQRPVFSTLVTLRGEHAYSSPMTSPTFESSH